MRIQAVYAGQDKINALVNDGHIIIEANVENQTMWFSAEVTEFATTEFLKTEFDARVCMSVDANVLSFVKSLFNIDHSFSAESSLIAYCSNSEFSAVMHIDTASSSVMLLNNGISTDILMDLSVENIVSVFASTSIDWNMAMSSIESIVFCSIGQEFSIELNMHDAVSNIVKSIKACYFIENGSLAIASDKKHISTAMDATMDFLATALVGKWRLLLEVDGSALSSIDNMTMEELDIIIM